MLAAENRLTSGDEFRTTVRSGVRAGGELLVVHWRPQTQAGHMRAGFVVSKAVGNAVVRTRVKRRLRHLTRELMDTLPGPGLLVVRALPPAAETSSEALRAELAQCLERAVRKSTASAPRGAS